MLQDNIGELQPSSGFQDTIDLPEDGLLARGQVYDAVREHDIKGMIRMRDDVRIDLRDLNILHAGQRKVLLCSPDHVFRQIDPRDTAALAHQRCGNEQIKTASAPDIQDRLSCPDSAQRERIADPARRFENSRGRTSDDRRVIPQSRCSLPACGIGELSGC